MSAPSSASLATLAQPLRDAHLSILSAVGSSAGSGSAAGGAAEASAASASAFSRGLHAWCMYAIQTATQAAPASRRGGGGGGVAASGSLHHEGSSAAAASATDAATLVFTFLSNMLQLLHMRPEMLDEDRSEANNKQAAKAAAEAAAEGGMEDEAASQVSTSTSGGGGAGNAFGGRSLLPFLYAHLFRYALHLQQYESYYQLLLHMPEHFHQGEGDVGGGGTSVATDGSGHQLKLECLKRFLIELLREKRTHHLITELNWNFPWNPRAQSKLQQESSASQSQGHDAAAALNAIEGKSVREEVEAVLWFNAETSDISDEHDAAATGSSTSTFLPSQSHNSAAFAQPSSFGMNAALGGGSSVRAIHSSHYDLLYSFLLSGHSYLRAAQCMQHFFLRLESETRAAGAEGASKFITTTVERIKKARGRALSAGQSKRGGAAAIPASHREQTQTEISALTLEVTGRLLRRKLHALVLIRDALQLAAASARFTSGTEVADPRECFMLENDSATLSLCEQKGESKQLESSSSGVALQSRSPLYKRSRNDEALSGAGDAADSPFPLASRLELLSLRGVSKRLEVLLSQLDMLAVLQERVAGGAHDVLPLDALVDTPLTDAQLSAHLKQLVRLGLFDRAFHLVQLLYDISAIEGSSAGGSVLSLAPLSSNPLNDSFELACTYLVRELAARICRAHASLIDGVYDENDVAFPLRIEESLAELTMQGKVARRGFAASGENVEALRLRDAEAVLLLYLDRFDGLWSSSSSSSSSYSASGRSSSSSSGLMAFSLAVVEEYLSSGAEVPLWLRDRFGAFMVMESRSSSDEDGERQQEHKSSSSSSLFRMQRSSSSFSRRSGHGSTLASFPFLSYLRRLLAHGRFELLFTQLCQYLDWVAEVDEDDGTDGGSSSSSIKHLDRAVVADLFEGFLWLGEQALSQPAGSPDAKLVLRQVQSWEQTLRHKLARLIGASALVGGSNSAALALGGKQKVTIGFGNQASTTTAQPFGFGAGGAAAGALVPAVVPPLGSSPPAAQTTASLPPTLPIGAVPAPSFRSSGAPSAAAPASSPSPFTGAGFGFGGSVAPSASPFASDHSAAATPFKHAFGGLAPLEPLVPAPTAAAAAAPSFSFGGGASSAGLFGAAAPPSAPISFGFSAPAPSSSLGVGGGMPNPFVTTTAASIARAAAGQ